MIEFGDSRSFGDFGIFRYLVEFGDLENYKHMKTLETLENVEILEMLKFDSLISIEFAWSSKAFEDSRIR